MSAFEDTLDLDFKLANCYSNNPRIKGRNVMLDLTKDQLDEYIKCSNDPLYFISNYVKVVNVDHGLMQYKPRDYQREMIETFHNNRFSICKMCRQSGKTTTVGAYFLWIVLFHPDKTLGILANKEKLAIEIMDRVKMAYEYLPWFLQQGVLIWNKKGITLENGSRIIADATSSNSVRGFTFNTILLDEFAHIDGSAAEEFFESVYPTISSGEKSKIIIVSTPKGMNMFYKLWVDSEEGRNTYARVEVHWSQVPGRDEAWKEETIANTSSRLFDQEQECLFLGSANTLIAGHKLRTMAYKNPVRELAQIHTQETVRVYKEPEEGHSYVMTVDISEGVGLDYQALKVFDVTAIPYEEVASFTSNEVTELLYPDIIRAVGMYYNEAMVLIENNLGREVANTLEIDLEYENLINVGNDKRMGQFAGGGGRDAQNGVKMSKSVKRIGCTNLKTLIEEDKLIIHDYDTIQELFNFVEQKGTYAADGNGNDDNVMTMVIFAWLTTQDYFKELVDLDVRARLMAEREKMAEEEVLQFFNTTHDDNERFVDRQGNVWSSAKTPEDDPFDDGWGRF